MGFTFKGFDFSMLWQGATQVSKKLEDIYYTPFSQGNNRNLHRYFYDNRFISEELTPNATYPRLSNAAKSWNYDLSMTNSHWVKDASYLRLKNIELGYSIATPKMKKAGFQKIRIYANANNVLTIDKIKFIDPEESGSKSEYPMLSVVNLGVNLNF